MYMCLVKPLLDIPVQLQSVIYFISPYLSFSCAETVETRLHFTRSTRCKDDDRVVFEKLRAKKTLNIDLCHFELEKPF